MEEFTQNYFTLYNDNNFKNSSLNQTMKYNNYINQRNNEYNNYNNEISQNQIINNNNSNISQDTISLVQIKNDLDLMNNKLNMISETLFNMNLFNSTSKNKINLKKSNSMNHKYIKTNKKISPNIYNARYNIKDLTMNNFGKTYSFINNDINNKLIKNNNSEINNDINANCFPKGQYNSFINNYFAQTHNMTKPKKNKKIHNMKYRRNNSIIASNNFNNKYTFDDTLNINNFILENNSKKNINYNNTNKINNDKDCFENPFFGLYDQYFLEGFSVNTNKQNEELEDNIINNNMNNEELNDIEFNHKNEINQMNDKENKKLCNNIYDNKKKLIFSNFKNNIKKIKTNNKTKPELILSQQTNLLNKIYNQYNKNNIKCEKNPKKEKNIINNEEINKIEKNNKIIINKKTINKNKIDIKAISKDENNFANIKKFKDNKKNKNLSFHEEDNITIEYNKKDEITKINVFDFFGENQNFQPRNVNVILEKLKRKKSKSKSILINNDNKKNLTQSENKKETKKVKKSNSGISIRSNKEEMLLNKYKLLKNRKTNSNKTYNNNYNIKRKNKLCEKFKNNPQLFYNEELCDLVIKSFDLDGIYINRNNSKGRNKNENYKLTNKKENMTDIYFNDEPMEYLQKIIEETE